MSNTSQTNHFTTLIMSILCCNFFQVDYNKSQNYFPFIFNSKNVTRNKGKDFSNIFFLLQHCSNLIPNVLMSKGIANFFLQDLYEFSVACILYVQVILHVHIYNTLHYNYKYYTTMK
jgi:hypothetical protein